MNKPFTSKSGSFLFILGIIFSSFSLQAQQILSTTPTLTANNGAGGISFNVYAATDLEITEIHNVFYEFNQNYSIWYSKDSINGSPFIAANAGWIKHQSGVIAGDGKTTKVVVLNSPIIIEAGETFGFYIEGNSRFMTASTLPFVFSDQNLRINTGSQVGYGGPINPTTHIRQFVGALKYKVLAESNNNAGMVALQNAVFCSGTQNIDVTVRNSGINRINSLNVNWSVNGTLQTPFAYNSMIDTFNGPGTNLATFNIGTWNFSTGQTYDFKFWTSDPNGQTDTLNYNDTLSRSIGTALSGSFSIGGTAPDFTTFSQAVDALHKNGVCGAVVFNVRTGTYNEQVSFEIIPGASASNTITFRGVNKNSVVITYSGVSGNPATVYLKGTRFLTLTNFTIKNTGSTNAVGIQLMSMASNNIIDSNIVMLDTNLTTVSSMSCVIAASSSLTSVSGTGSNSFNNTISNNELYGGYYSLRLTGESSTSFNSGNRVLNNKLRNFYYYGLYVIYQQAGEIDGNLVDGFGPWTPTYNLYVSSSIDMLINANRVVNAGTYGVYLSIINNGNGTKTTVSNNIVGRSFTGTTHYGFYVSNTKNTDFLHNTSASDVSGTNYPFYITSTSGSNNIKVKNNIFAGTTGVAFYTYNASFVSELDYNVYYTTATNLLYLGANYTSLAAAQSAYPQLNKNSVVQSPDFVSTTDLHLKNTLAPRGKFAGISTDFDKDARCIVFPTIGADESTFPVAAPVASYVIPDTLWQSSPFVILNKALPGDTKAHRWFLNSVLISSELHLNFNFPDTGYHQLMLVTENCGGTDTIENTIYVSKVLTAPIADFAASNLNPEVYQDIVTLSDSSTRGATSWEWKISPAQYIDPNSGAIATYFWSGSTNEFSKNPQITFTKGGSYSICLIATNVMGSDTICKANYIVVKESVSMCISTSTNSESGFLYDDGGVTNYTGGVKTCGFLIDPCASQISLQILEFDLKGGDYLRIYDGKTNSGTPLWDNVAYPTGMNGTMTSASVIKSLMVADSGYVYLEFVTDASTTTVGTGFRIEWTSVPLKGNPPVAAFSSPSSICTANPAFFKNASVGHNLTYQWYVNGSFFDNTKDIVNTFSASGSYEIKLVAENCSGTDTFINTVNVIVPTTAPTAAFMASSQIVDLTEIAILTDTTSYCVSSRDWVITPSTFTYMNGTNKNSAAPNVRFNAAGCYTVKLVVRNSLGADSLEQACFIKAISYCKPTVTNLTSGIGISRVKISSVDNSTSAGVAAYTDYTATKIARLSPGGNYNITVSRSAGNNPVSRAVWIDFNRDGTFDNTELAASSINSTDIDWTSSISVPTTVTTGGTRMRVAINFSNLPVTPCGPSTFGEFEDYRIMFMLDTVAPVLELDGSDTVYTELGYAYAEPGYTATDDAEGDISPLVLVSGTVDTMNTGTYVLYYNVSDNAGNAAAQQQRVVIVTPDVTAPVITLNGKMTDTVAVYGTWGEPGYSVADKVDANPLVTVSGTVNTSFVNYYDITYTATDAAGNSSFVVRRVWVLDTIAPILTLLGSDSLFIGVGSNFIDPGLTVTENYDHISKVKITVTGIADANRTGVYFLRYCATDSSGNTTCKERKVAVGDTVKPVITLFGDNPDTAYRYVPYTEPGFLATDNYDPLPQVFIAGDAPNTLEFGEFTIKYYAKDNSGNVSDTVSRRVVIINNPSGIPGNIAEDATVNIYPNPGADVFNIELKGLSNEKVTISVVNMLGSELIKVHEGRSAQDVYSFSMNGYAPGLYFVKVATDGEQKVYKIILQ